MLLDLIQRLVRLPVEHIVIRLPARHGRADAQRHFFSVFLHCHSLHTVQHLDAALLHNLRIAHCLHEDHKLVAAQSADYIIRAETRLQNLSRLFQHLITRIMAQVVIDLLEIIDIHDNHGSRTVPVFLHQYLPHQLMAGSRIVDPGQAVPLGFRFQLSPIEQM